MYTTEIAIENALERMHSITLERIVMLILTLYAHAEILKTFCTNNGFRIVIFEGGTGKTDTL